MNVTIAAPRSCSKCSALQEELVRLNVPFTLRYFEDHPNLADEYKNMQPPVLIADGALVFVGLPRPGSLRSFFDSYSSC